MSDKLNIIIAERDSHYTALLADYARSTEWSRKVNVRQVTQQETLLEYVRQGTAQMYLLHPDFEAAEKPGLCRLTLCETKQAAEQMGVSGIYKYQPLHQLLSKIVERYRQFAEADGAPARKSGPSLHTVFSAAGGVGKTTVAIHLARALAENGERCLYWNMELVPGNLLPHMPDAEQTARFMYGLRVDAPWLKESFSSLLSRSEPHGFEYFAGFGEVREALDLTREDVSRLIAWLKQSGRYDTIVFDCEAGPHPRLCALLGQSDTGLCIVTEDADSAVRASRLLAEAELWEGGGPGAAIRFVMNKHLDSGVRMLPGLAGGQGAVIAAKLPYVPGWAVTHAGRGTAVEPLFHSAIARLLPLVRRAGGEPA